MVLTEAGRMLFTRFQSYQDQLRAALEEITEPDREPSGTIRVGLYLGFPQAPLAQFLAEFGFVHLWL